MDNNSIINLLHTTAALLSLHGANIFQINHYTRAAEFLEKLDQEIFDCKEVQLKQIASIPESLIKIIEEIQHTGTLHRWQELSTTTPPGLLEILTLPGLGPNKVRSLWQELGIEGLEGLEECCKSGKVARLKGFGEKTQATILEALLRKEQYKDKYHYITAASYSQAWELEFNKQFPTIAMVIVGDLRRKLEVITTIECLVDSREVTTITAWLSCLPHIQFSPAISGPFVWRGFFIDNKLPLHIIFCKSEEFYKQIITHTGSSPHLALTVADGITLGKIISETGYLTSEMEGYQKANLPYIPPEIREGVIEKSWIEAGKPALIEVADIRGVLHIHTNYSDGKNTLESMAIYCKELGYDYIGITDHSKSAAYAGGLQFSAIQEQHKVIDALNHKMVPFKIWKGIECDILPDGSLDYPEEILKTFDFVIASVHTGLSMDQERATKRLLKAISNPYTTILGHLTGRLLLKREGYPIDYKSVIDACADYGVVIEINANPSRLELDWRWVPYALQKEVKLSINPDAHQQNDVYNTVYGVYIGRKGGLTKKNTFNTFTLKQMEDYLLNRKKYASSTL